MHVVIGGAGEVGRNITEALRRDEHDVVLMDIDPEACEAASHLDAMIVEGHAASAEDLEQAGIGHADVFYAVTSLDEVNLASAAIAKSHGAERVFARVNSLDLMEEAESRKFLPIGVDVAVSPDLVAAEKILRLVEFPGVLEMDAYELGDLRVVETRIEPGSPATGRTLQELELPEGANLVAVFRGAEVIIPQGDDRLFAGDRAVLLLAKGDLIDEVTVTFGERTNLREQQDPVNDIVVTGATGIAKRLASSLEKAGRRVTMVAQPDDRSGIEELAAEMEDILVLEGSSRDVRVFREEGLDEADVVIAASPHEEFNIITCLLAASMGVPRTMALVDQPELEELAERIGVGAAISPRLTAVSTLLKYGSELHPEELTLLRGGDAQLLLVDVEAGDRIVETKLKDADLPRGSVVGAILRDGRTIVPRGDERVQIGDDLVLFAVSEAVSELTDLL